MHDEQRRDELAGDQAGLADQRAKGGTPPESAGTIDRIHAALTSTPKLLLPDIKGEAMVDGKARPFGPGAVVHLPLGSTLELVNEAPDQPLRYLIIKAQGPGHSPAEPDTIER